MEKNVKIVKVDNQDLINYIESLQYEVNARKEIIAFMLNNDMRMDTDSYQKYNKEYIDFYVKYDTAKSELEKTYVKTAVEYPKWWNLDFKTGEITITY